MANPVYPCLWFNNQAHEAALFYCRIFENGKILSQNQMVINFEIMGRKFMALNGGPHFQINEAISLVIECKNQEEIDHYWNTLISEGGEESRCGWLKDKFGVSWQIIPEQLGALMSDPARAPQVGAALMKMNKIDLQILLNA